ncbi:MAG: radical SAM protein [Euryarchaeota archaeon]|nr:radical SAM protein [Euryarchaeota archaeon]
MRGLDELMARARNASWERFDRRIAFYHPGMFRYEGKWGQYSAISITGDSCELQCDHCKARLLEPMIHATTPETLVKTCQDLEKRGDRGCLITGGFRKDGTLLWDTFIDAIRTVKETTNLHISIHGGIIGSDMAESMKEAGIDQVLLDVIGDDETLKKVFHVDFGLEKIVETLDSLTNVRMPIVPHSLGQK